MPIALRVENSVPEIQNVPVGRFKESDISYRVDPEDATE